MLNVHESRGMQSEASGRHPSADGGRAIRLSDTLLVRVRSIVYECEGINSYLLEGTNGASLPRFAAGSHVDVHLEGGAVRQYSLCNDPNETGRYRIAVQREAQGRGGSRQIFAQVRVGQLLEVSKPRNHFVLSQVADRHLLIAGGIGITPLLAMAYQLGCAKAAFELHYCTRTPERTPFLAELKQFGDAVHIHHDHGEPANGLNFASLLKQQRPGTHLYFCGPPGFMAAVAAAAAHWPKPSIHFEHFSAAAVAPAHATAGNDCESFQIQIASTGRLLDVPANKSITQVLAEQGIPIETSCEAGLCGTCRTRYISGTPDHRDLVLQDDEKREYLLPCCSRSKSAILVLDL